jgi:hypothetical protein
MAEFENGKLSRRDFIILPLISIITIVVMLCGVEFAAHLAWVDHRQDSCLDVSVMHYKANCYSRTKVFEGPWVENRYNECGYRTKEPCGPTPAGTIRVAVLGTSYAEGFSVPYEETYLAFASKELGGSCRRPVEFQNLAVAAIFFSETAKKIDEALRLKPDLVLLVVIPHDLFIGGSRENTPKTEQARRLVSTVLQHFDPANFWHRAKQKLLKALNSTRTFMVSRHFLYRDPQTYLEATLREGDMSDYLRVPLTPMWESRLIEADEEIGAMADKAHEAGVPMMLVVGFDREEEVLSRLPQTPANVDAFAFSSRLLIIARNHDVLTVNTQPYLRDAANPSQLFWPYDPHLTPEGQKLLGQILRDRLLEGDVQAFSSCSQSTKQAPR